MMMIMMMRNMMIMMLMITVRMIVRGLPPRGRDNHSTADVDEAAGHQAWNA